MASSIESETIVDEVDEQTSFIHHHHQQDGLDPSRGKSSIFSRAAPFMAIHFSLAFFEMIINAPLLYLFEQSLCSSYYMNHNPSLIGHNGWVDESYCRLPEIQHDLATIRGWKSFFDTLPVFLVAIPMGRLADRYGRKKMMAINLAGVLVSLSEVLLVCSFPKIFPLQLVWLSSAIQMLGGGLYTSAALMWAQSSEMFLEEERSKGYYYIFSAFYVAEMISSSLASATLDISPWIPFALAYCSIFSCLIIQFRIPNRSKQRTPNSPNINEGRNVAELPKATSLKDVFSNANILLALPVFLVGSTRYTVLNALMQYAHVRFGWVVSRTALIYTETAVVNICLFLIIIPRLTTFIKTRFGTEPQVIDLTMVRTSVFLLSLGTLCLALSPNATSIIASVLVYAAGFGSRVSTLSLVSFWISDDSKATFYAAVAVLENVGHAIADPTLQQIFATMLARHTDSSRWLALPFFVAAVWYGIAGLSSMFIQIEKKRVGRRSE